MLKQIATNTFFQVLGRLTTAAISFAITLLLARSLGSFYFGEYVTITTFVLMFSVLIDFGFNAFFVKYLTHTVHTPLAQFRALLTLRFLLALLVFMLTNSLILVLHWFGAGYSWRVVIGVLLSSTSLFFYPFIHTAAGLFQFQLNYKRTISTLILGGMAGFIVTCIGVFSGVSRESLLIFSLLGFVLGTAVSGMSSLLLIDGLSLLNLLTRKTLFWKELFLKSWPLGIVLLGNLLYVRLDIWLLNYFRTPQEVGMYGLAYRFFDFALVLPTFIMNSYYPLLIRPNHVRLKISTFILTLLGLSVLLAVILWLGAPLLTLIQAEYAPAVLLLRLLSLSLPIFFMTSPLMWWFVIKNKQRYLLGIYGIGLLANLVLNISFIPRFGAQAAAISTGVSELLVCMLGGILYLLLKRRAV